jgi:hypothetical protein
LAAPGTVLALGQAGDLDIQLVHVCISSSLVWGHGQFEHQADLHCLVKKLASVALHRLRCTRPLKNCLAVFAGRYSDDIAAATAYDKAAMYLYGRNAITNFGLDACQKDQTEVSIQATLIRLQKAHRFAAATRSSG